MVLSRHNVRQGNKQFYMKFASPIFIKHIFYIYRHKFLCDEMCGYCHNFFLRNINCKNIDRQRLLYCILSLTWKSEFLTKYSHLGSAAISLSIWIVLIWIAITTKKSLRSPKHNIMILNSGFKVFIGIRTAVSENKNYSKF